MLSCSFDLVLSNTGRVLQSCPRPCRHLSPGGALYCLVSDPGRTAVTDDYVRGGLLLAAATTRRVSALLRTLNYAIDHARVFVPSLCPC